MNHVQISHWYWMGDLKKSNKGREIQENYAIQIPNYGEGMLQNLISIISLKKWCLIFSGHGPL